MIHFTRSNQACEKQLHLSSRRLTFLTSLCTRDVQRGSWHKRCNFVVFPVALFSLQTLMFALENLRLHPCAPPPSGIFPFSSGVLPDHHSFASKMLKDCFCEKRKSLISPPSSGSYYAAGFNTWLSVGISSRVIVIMSNFFYKNIYCTRSIIF